MAEMTPDNGSVERKKIDVRSRQNVSQQEKAEREMLK
jgi:hypothetical protein